MHSDEFTIPFLKDIMEMEDLPARHIKCCLSRMDHCCLPCSNFSPEGGGRSDNEYNFSLVVFFHYEAYRIASDTYHTAVKARCTKLEALVFPVREN